MTFEEAAKKAKKLGVTSYFFDTPGIEKFTGFDLREPIELTEEEREIVRRLNEFLRDRP